MLEPEISQEVSGPTNGLDAELGVLAQMHAVATREGRRIDAAVLEVKHAEKFAAWCAKRKKAIADQILSLEASRRTLTLRISWWRELNSLDEESSDLSSAQKSIFEGREVTPRDWGQANEALSLLPEFDLPLRGNFNSWHASFLEIDAVTKLLQEDLRRAISQFDTTDARNPSWNVYRDETHPELDLLFKQLEETWAAAEFSR